MRSERNRYITTGFGTSVLQRLCKTSIKKNLYYEIKDKVIEESFDGVRTLKKSAKVRVYGTDSCKEVRSRLIEILYDRVAMHKDKFIAPILHHEMESMEVKKNGKVEHSQNSHDDQVFSYLMALVVWYDGTDIMERYGIRKNTIKTDEDVDIEALSIESEGFGMITVNMDDVTRGFSGSSAEEDIVTQQLDYLKDDATRRLGRDFAKEQEKADEDCLKNLLATDKVARVAYARKYNLMDDDPKVNGGSAGFSGFVELPDDLFGETEVGFDDDYQDSLDVLAGNLADQFRSLL